MKIHLDPSMNLPIIFAESQHNLFALLERFHEPIMQSLHEYGSLLFRGFSCEKVDDFSTAIQLCNLGTRLSTADYNLPRTVIKDNIYVSSELPAHCFIPLHHEKPRSKEPPNHLYFCCPKPAKKGGATLFANAEHIWRDVSLSIQEKIAQHGVLYKQYFFKNSIKYRLIKKGMNNVACWPQYYNTSLKNEVENRVAEGEMQWEWVKGALVLSTVLPGVRTHYLNEKKLWFNGAHYLNYYSNSLYKNFAEFGLLKSMLAQYLIRKDQFPMICHYGNGIPFSGEEIAVINQAIDKNTYPFYWQKGDFMIVDNYTLMHGKEPHEGNRLLYSCMTQCLM